MSRVVKILPGEEIPEGAKFLKAAVEPDYSNRSYFERPYEYDPLNYIPIIGSLFGTVETGYRVPMRDVFYYEVE